MHRLSEMVHKVIAEGAAVASGEAGRGVDALGLKVVDVNKQAEFGEMEKPCFAEGCTEQGSAYALLAERLANGE